MNKHRKLINKGCVKLLLRPSKHVFEVHGYLKDGQNGCSGKATMIAEDEGPLLTLLYEFSPLFIFIFISPLFLSFLLSSPFLFVFAQYFPFFSFVLFSLFFSSPFKCKCELQGLLIWQD